VRRVAQLHQRVRLTTPYVTHDQVRRCRCPTGLPCATAGSSRSARLKRRGAARAPFAAQFLGGANIITGDAQSDGSGSLVRTGFGVLRTARTANGAVSLFVRPENVALVDRGDGPNRFACRVVSQRFLGDIRQLELQLPEGGQVLGCKTRIGVVAPDAADIAYIDPRHLEVLREDAP
jgi:putative spermidine/putrescine transport system ATP-binding protein